MKVKANYESMASDFFAESNKLLASWKQCIFYLSEAYIEVFYTSHEITEDSKHQCCFRYFPDEEFKLKFNKSTNNVASTDSGKKYCTCTVIDHLF